MTSQRIVTGAHYGIGSWLLQRLSAVLMVIYTVILIVAVLRLPEFNYGNWATLFVHPFMKVSTLLAGRRSSTTRGSGFATSLWITSSPPESGSPFRQALFCCWLGMAAGW